jgi:hypothetical protein
MRSHIKWTKLVEYRVGYSNRPLSINHFGKSQECDFYLNIYSFEGEWCWTVRSSSMSVNLFSSGAKSYKTKKEAEIQCAKWAVIYFLYLIHPEIVKGELDADYVYWYKPLKC